MAQQLLDWLLVLLTLIVSGCIPLIAKAIVNWIRVKIGVEQMVKVSVELGMEESLAMEAVRFIEQLYIKSGVKVKGEEKLTQACIYLANRLREKGLEIDSKAIEGLIESALRMFKDEFGEEWAKITE